MRKPFEIPDSIISQLDECTGSYYLMSTDQHGTITTHTNFDNLSHELAVLTFMKLDCESRLRKLAKDLLESPEADPEDLD